MAALTTKKMVVVAISIDRLLAGRKMTGKGVSIGAAAIAAMAAVMGGLKMKFSMKVFNLGGHTGRRWLFCTKKQPKRLVVATETGYKNFFASGDYGSTGGGEGY